MRSHIRCANKIGFARSCVNTLEGTGPNETSKCLPLLRANVAISRVRVRAPGAPHSFIANCLCSGTDPLENARKVSLILRNHQYVFRPSPPAHLSARFHLRQSAYMHICLKTYIHTSLAICLAPVCLSISCASCLPALCISKSPFGTK